MIWVMGYRGAVYYRFCYAYVWVKIDFVTNITDSRSHLRRTLMPSVIPLAMTSFLGIILSVLVLFDDPGILYPAFIFNTVFRSFIYSMGAAYIGVM